MACYLAESEIQRRPHRIWRWKEDIFQIGEGS